MRFRLIIPVFVAVLVLVSCSQKTDRLPAYCPIPLTKQMPEYPEILNRAAHSSTVELSALVDEDGHVVDVKILRSVPALDSVSIVAARAWTFKPGKIADQTGKYVNARFWFPIIFEWQI